MKTAIVESLKNAVDGFKSNHPPLGVEEKINNFFQQLIIESPNLQKEEIAPLFEKERFDVLVTNQKHAGIFIALGYRTGALEKKEEPSLAIQEKMQKIAEEKWPQAFVGENLYSEGNLHAFSLYSEYAHVTGSAFEKMAKAVVRDNVPADFVAKHPKPLEQIEKVGLNRLFTPPARLDLLEEEGDFYIHLKEGTEVEKLSVTKETEQLNALFDKLKIAKKDPVRSLYTLHDRRIERWSLKEHLKDVSTREGYLERTLEQDFPPMVTYFFEELQKKYPSLRKGESVFQLTTTHINDNLEIDNNHGMLAFISPLDNGRYGFFPFGLYPEHFPEHILETLPFVVRGYKGEIRYPDHPRQLPGRFVTTVDFLITEEQQKKLVASLREELLLMKNKPSEIHFHPRTHNCGQWAEKVFKRALPEDIQRHERSGDIEDLFRVDTDDVEQHRICGRFALEVLEHTVWVPLMYLKGMLLDFTIAIPQGLVENSQKTGVYLYDLRPSV